MLPPAGGAAAAAASATSTPAAATSTTCHQKNTFPLNGLCCFCCYDDDAGENDDYDDGDDAGEDFKFNQPTAPDNSPGNRASSDIGQNTGTDNSKRVWRACYSISMKGAIVTGHVPYGYKEPLSQAQEQATVQTARGWYY